MGSMTKDEEKEEKHTKKFITKNPKVMDAYYFLIFKSQIKGKNSTENNFGM